jgi:hypothetical protein
MNRLFINLCMPVHPGKFYIVSAAHISAICLPAGVFWNEQSGRSQSQEIALAFHQQILLRMQLFCIFK